MQYLGPSEMPASAHVPYQLMSSQLMSLQLMNRRLLGNDAFPSAP